MSVTVGLVTLSIVASVTSLAPRMYEAQDYNGSYGRGRTIDTPHASQRVYLFDRRFLEMLNGINTRCGR